MTTPTRWSCWTRLMLVSRWTTPRPWPRRDRPLRRSHCGWWTGWNWWPLHTAACRGLSSHHIRGPGLGGQLVSLYPSKPVTNFPAHLDVASGELARRLAEQAAHFGAELRNTNQWSRSHSRATWGSHCGPRTAGESARCAAGVGNGPLPAAQAGLKDEAVSPAMVLCITFLRVTASWPATP